MPEDQCHAIVAYEVSEVDSERFLDSWERANAFLQEQPGHISTTLHRAASANPDFRFVNVSCWESADAFRAATQNLEFREVASRLEAFPIHAAVYDVVRS
jgi:heme oxygenase (mycobilin-producing)